MKLYLVRHAPALDRDETGWPDDVDRPLTSEGASKFFLAARGLFHIAPAVDVLYSSPLLRARQTAAILKQECEWAEPVVSHGLGPDRPAAAALDAIGRRAFEPAVAVVGHEPQLSDLLNLLIGGGDRATGLHFTEGSTACLGFDGAFRPSGATLLWLLTPSILRRVRRKRRLDDPMDEDDLREAG